MNKHFLHGRGRTLPFRPGLFQQHQMDARTDAPKAKAMEAFSFGREIQGDALTSG
jgi:hypothetical protein